MSKKYLNLSRTMAHALRHAPQNYGLSLDKRLDQCRKICSGFKNYSNRFKDLTIYDLEELIKI